MGTLKIFILLSSASFFISSFKDDNGPNRKGDLAVYELKGKVKTVTEIEKNFPNNERFKSIDTILIAFNEVGKQLMGYYGGRGSIDSFKYDEKGNKIEIINYRGNLLRGKVTYKYDDKNNIIEVYEFRSDELFDSFFCSPKTTYKYDEKGNVIEQVECSYSRLSEAQHEALRWDVTREIPHLTNNSSDYSTWIYFYDKNENIIKSQWYRENKVTREIIYIHNEKGILIRTSSIRIHSSSSDSVVTKFIYDKKDNKIVDSIISYANGNYANTFYKKFDVYGNLIESSYKSTEDKKAFRRTFKYKYDSVGNWIKKTEIQNRKTILVQEREITYY